MTSSLSYRSLSFSKFQALRRLNLKCCVCQIRVSSASATVSYKELPPSVATVISLPLVKSHISGLSLRDDLHPKLVQYKVKDNGSPGDTLSLHGQHQDVQTFPLDTEYTILRNFKFAQGCANKHPLALHNKDKCSKPHTTGVENPNIVILTSLQTSRKDNSSKPERDLSEHESVGDLPCDCSGQSQQEEEKSKEKKPSPDQLEKVAQTLSIQIDEFYQNVKSLDDKGTFEIYHPNVTFINNLDGRASIFSGVKSLKWQLTMLKGKHSVKYVFNEVNLKDVMMDTDKATVHVGFVVRRQTNLQFYTQLISKFMSKFGRTENRSFSHVEAYVLCAVGEDGLIHKIILDKHVQSPHKERITSNTVKRMLGRLKPQTLSSSQ